MMVYTAEVEQLMDEEGTHHWSDLDARNSCDEEECKLYC